jgi:hypothetical protein
VNVKDSTNCLPLVNIYVCNSNHDTSCRSSISVGDLDFWNLFVGQIQMEMHVRGRPTHSLIINAFSPLQGKTPCTAQWRAGYRDSCGYGGANWRTCPVAGMAQHYLSTRTSSVKMRELPFEIGNRFQERSYSRCHIT